MSEQVVFQYRTWGGSWSPWTNCEADTYEHFKYVAEKDSSVEVRIHTLPQGVNTEERFVNWWASLASPFVVGHDPVIAANQAWYQSRYETEKEMLEVVAQAIYDQWRFMPGWEPWVPYGNSLRQTDARALAQNYRKK